MPDKITCYICNGKGSVYDGGDLHHSAGWEPCIKCNKTGYISKEQEIERIETQIRSLKNKLKKLKKDNGK